MERAQGPQWLWAQGLPPLHQRFSLCVPISSLPRGAGLTQLLGVVALQDGDICPGTHCPQKPWARWLPHLGKCSPMGKLSFGKSLKAHVPQRASSPSAATRGIWYLEFWSIWRWMWCDLQQGNRDRLPGKESKLFLTSPAPLLQPQPTLWVSTKME